MNHSPLIPEAHSRRSFVASLLGAVAAAAVAPAAIEAIAAPELVYMPGMNRLDIITFEWRGPVTYEAWIES